MLTILERAYKYRQQGFSVFPIIPETKRPAVDEVMPYRTRYATDEELDKWFKDGKKNIGIVTGELSNLTVVDFDVKYGGLETLKKLNPPMTLVVKTGGGGYHYYYNYFPKCICSNDGTTGLDIKTEGGYIVAPGSIHETGNYYEEVTEFDRDIMIDFPENTVPYSSKNSTSKNTPDKWKDILEVGVTEGNRNNSCAKVAGFLLSRIERKNWRTAWIIYEMWCENKIKPKLSKDEYTKTFLSIANMQENKNKEVGLFKFENGKVINNTEKINTILNSLKK
jgi:hypothetical protein